jgi:thiol-disulfide isomerase/thioredoxin
MIHLMMTGNRTSGDYMPRAHISPRQAIGILSVLLFLIPTPSFGQAKPKPRSVKEIQTDLAKVRADIDLTSFISDRFDPKYQRFLTPKLTPLLSEKLALLQEISSISQTQKSKYQLMLALTETELAYFGDAQGDEFLAAQAQSPDKSESKTAALGKELKAWWEANGDANAQLLILEQLGTLAKSQPFNDDIAQVSVVMIKTSPANQEVVARLNDILCNTLKGNAALHFANMPNKIGKPLVIGGSSLTGPPFSSEKWKGKVILVDFWATWCQPCRESLPELIQLYSKYHDKGLEIVGVSSDSSREDLLAFLKQNPDMRWPQLFVGNTTGDWHSLTKRFGIESIPTLYLIDRNGILRTMDGRNNTQAQVTQLLDEPVNGKQ